MQPVDFLGPFRKGHSVLYGSFQDFKSSPARATNVLRYHIVSGNLDFQDAIYSGFPPLLQSMNGEQGCASLLSSQGSA